MDEEILVSGFSSNKNAFISDTSNREFPLDILRRKRLKLAKNTMFYAVL
jgi:hypothetical protein